MPNKYTSAVYVKGGVPDYDEGQGSKGLVIAGTCRRLEDAGLYKRAIKTYKAEAKRYPDVYNTGDVEADKRMKGVYLRTHYPPPAMLEEGSLAACESESGEDESAADPPVVQPSEAPSLFLPDVCKIVHDDETVDENAQNAVEFQEKPRRDEDSEVVDVPADNSIEISKELRTLTLAELVTACTWAFDNAMHVASKRVKIRHAPVSPSGCWMLTKWILKDDKGFFSFFFDKLKAWEKEQEAKREKAEKSLRDEDTELFDVFDELGATG